MTTATASTPTRPRKATAPSRLILMVDGVPYSVRPIEVEIGSAYRLLSPSGAVSTVEDDHHGAWCSCSDFQESEDAPLTCRHVRALRAAGLINPVHPDDLEADPGDWPDWTDDSEYWPTSAK